LIIRVKLFTGHDLVTGLKEEDYIGTIAVFGNGRILEGYKNRNKFWLIK